MAVLSRRAPLAFALALGLGLAACGPDAGESARQDARHDRPVTEAQAETALAAALDLQPENPQLLLVLGDCQLRLDQDAEADAEAHARLAGNRSPHLAWGDLPDPRTGMMNFALDQIRGAGATEHTPPWLLDRLLRAKGFLRTQEHPGQQLIFQLVGRRADGQDHRVVEFATVIARFESRGNGFGDEASRPLSWPSFL